ASFRAAVVDLLGVPFWRPPYFGCPCSNAMRHLQDNVSDAQRGNGSLTPDTAIEANDPCVRARRPIGPAYGSPDRSPIAPTCVPSRRCAARPSIDTLKMHEIYRLTDDRDSWVS